MTRPPILLAGFLSGMVLLPFAEISAQGAERDGETTAVRAGEMTSTAPASSWIPPWFPKAPVLAPSVGAVIRVATVEELLMAVDRVEPGGTILLAEGHYRLPRVMVLRDKKKIALRSASGDPAKTVLSGRGWDSQTGGDDILHVAHCEGVTIADLSFTDCRSYGIKVEAESAPQDIHIYNCRFRDIGVRAIKGSAGQDPNVRAVKGSVRYCTFENTRVPPADWLFGGDYIAAIDMMALEDWTFSDNLFRSIRGRNGGGRAAIFIWVRSRRVVVERNFILDCDRGVAFGNPGQSTANLAGERLVYVADSVIRNNFIAGGPDCGIELWFTDGIKVQHNSIWRPEQNWRRGIRIGTGTSNAQVVNNLVHGEILLEGGEADLRSNRTGRLDNDCVDPASGNLALTPAATRAIDQAVLLPDVTEDIRRQSRAPRPDIGAWEFGAGEPSGPAPVVFELDLGQTEQIQVRSPAGPVERRIGLLAVREFYWPNYHIPDLPQRRVFRSAEVDVEVSGTRATLHARPFEMPQTVNGLRLYVETTRSWATEPQLDPMPEVQRAVRFSCVAAGEPWGPSELRFPIRHYRWRANTYGNTWLALVPYNKHYYHRGEDFGAIPDRLEVLASLGGVITRSPLPTGDQESNGLQIQCPSGLELGYFHMNVETLLPHRTNGAAVRSGDLLGRTGMTWAGRKSQHNDPHLHWGVSVRGAPLASYPFVAEAYLRDYPDPLLAVAGGYHYAIPGDAVELDASRSLARTGRRIVRYQWRLHDGREVEGPHASVKADQPGLFSEELRLLADDGSEDRDYAQLRVWNPHAGAAFAAGWFYHWPLRGARPGTPVLFWNRLSGTTSPVEIDFGDNSNPDRIGQEITHVYAKAGIYTATLRSRGPADEPVEVRMRVVIDP